MEGLYIFMKIASLVNDVSFSIYKLKYPHFFKKWVRNENKYKVKSWFYSNYTA